MPFYSGYNGVVKEITELPVGYDGAVKQTEGLYCGYQGVNKLVFGRYRWEKWDVKTEDVYDLVSEVQLGTSFFGDVFYTSYTIDQSKQTVTPSGKSIKVSSVDAMNSAIENGYIWTTDIFPDDKDKSKIILKVNNVVEIGGDPFAIVIKYGVGIVHKAYKGDNLLEIVQSDNSNTYPVNGAKDGFWYVKVQ